MVEATGALDDIAPPKVVNADALALSTFAGKLGVVVTPALDPWRSWPSHFRVRRRALLRSCRGVQRGTGCPDSAPEKSASVATASNTGNSGKCPSGKGPNRSRFSGLARRAKGGTITVPKLTVADDAAERLLLMVAHHGTELLGSNRTFGRALGVSHTQAGRVLDELEASGRVRLRAESRERS